MNQEEESLPRPQAMSASGVRAEALQEEADSLRKQIAAASDEIAAFGKESAPSGRRLPTSSSVGAAGPGVIQLGTSLWGIPGKHEFLFNRNFQVGVDLARAFVQKRESVIVAGSKGIGKSCLGLVIVDTLVKDGQIVAYESGNTQMLLVPSKAALTRFTTAASVIGCFTSFLFQMVDEVGLYKFVRQDDGALFRDLCLCTDLVHVWTWASCTRRLLESSFPKIVISSPNADKLKRFGEIQLGANYIIYPVWTLEELKKMNSELVGDKKQADDVLKTKYELFGGIPRQIFLGETVEQAMERLTAAVNQVTIETWKAAFFASSYTTITRQVPGLFVRITASTAPGRQCNVEFASDCIMQLAIRHHARTNRAELVGFLNALSSPPRMMSALQGYLLEEAMHAALLSLQPIEYQLLDLTDQAPPSNSRQVTFPRLTERQFSRKDMSDIVGVKENDYFRPTFPTFPAVESFAILDKSVLFGDKKGLCIVGFQATVSANHLVKRSGLKAIQEKVKALHGQLDLYVVFATNKGKGIDKRQKLAKKTV
ncbi:hypothetical protein BASA81_003387 [Batrachochytrium salamandrivorans]|nr:hypothetical protein BASA81_003387 [Batrachochytrium salamandrivorans]